MSDIVEKLRAVSPDDYDECSAIMNEAADRIEQLESDLSDALTDLNTAQQDNASCSVHIHNQAARIEKLEAQVADFIEQANTKCACAHDRPEDVCLAHSPIVAKQAARIEQLEATLREIDMACSNTGWWSPVVMERIIERVQELSRAALEKST